MSLSIVPSEKSDDDIIKEIREKFKLNIKPFDKMDDDLILLAFIPTCKTGEINIKYGVCNHQSLEFFGDKVYGSIITSLLYELFRLKQSAHFYTQLFSEFAKNILLTDLMINHQGCKLVRDEPFTINMKVKKKKFHNVCADSFEALLGAMYVYLEDENQNSIELIKYWLFRYTKLPYIIKKNFHRKGLTDIPIYVINDQEALEKNWTTVGMNIKNKNYQLSFSDKGIIVYHHTPIEIIFKLLNWKYNIVNEDGEIRVVIYPDEIEMIIGSGLNIYQAFERTKSYLKSRGYIVDMQSVTTLFSDQTEILPLLDDKGKPKSPKVRSQPNSPKVRSQPNSPKRLSSPKVRFQSNSPKVRSQPNSPKKSYLQQNRASSSKIKSNK